MKDVFSDIIKKSKWSQHVCGPGSTLNFTENLRKELVPLLKRHGIKSVLDLPCGDFSWMSETTILDEVDYIGADIVDDLIHKNKIKYPNVNFRILDLTKDNLPDVDLLFCRDCLLHLSFSDIDKAFSNIAKSNIKYVLLSNWFGNDAKNTKDIKTGSYRFINFHENPYNFGSSIDSIEDTIEGYTYRKMVLWEVDKTIRKYIGNKQ